MPALWDSNTYLNYVQEAVFFKLRKVHLFNASPIISKIYSMLKPFIKKELQEQIFFHSSHEDLYDIVSKESLPNDFGGETGSVKDLYETSWSGMKIISILWKSLINSECLRVEFLFQRESAYVLRSVEKIVIVRFDKLEWMNILFLTCFVFAQYVSQRYFLMEFFPISHDKIYWN